jgi:hypothetical protein
VLPDGYFERYENYMALCEVIWREEQDPSILASALLDSVRVGRPVPSWLANALFGVLTAQTAKAEAKRYNASAAHLARYRAVRDAVEVDKMTWDQAYEHAAAVTGCEPDTARKSYKLVKRNMREAMKD